MSTDTSYQTDGQNADRRRLHVNMRLLLATAGAVAVLGVGVHLVHAYQVGRNARSVLQRATAARDG
ncbi:MAG TPA: hypothetical protein VGH74_14165, partial [Planctomycetaceae bacterium]